ncbi:unnamed protein product [Cercopithifilaria johnstoni]|uniref:Uncharacterized protein n=1 Tax=Cercopithifilaria johnstoni TaxID=2874296 RepID=A0A8J2Q7H2_9BILA|nr:unnamed protein product [Cercopithifilaria johnstoni]
MYPLRTAAYDTSFKAITNKAFEEYQQFAIVAISNIPSDIASSETYQLISVNEFGVAIIWTVINEETARTTDYDLGLRPGAQLKMTQTSVIQPDSVIFSNLNSSRKMTVNCMTMVPTNAAQFLLGTTSGIIINFVASKANKLFGPKMYRNDFAKSKKPESVDDLKLKDGYEVTTAELWQYIVTPSNSYTNLLAIGFSNGEVQLHGLSKSSTNYDNRKRNKSLSNAIKVYKNM